GWVAGPQGLEPMSPLFVDLFKGALCLFLLEMGLIAADRLPDLKKAGLFLVGCGLALPPVLALGGWGVAQLMGLGVGGTVLMMTLAGSASYIAAPTAMRIAVPEANPALGVAAALAVTFPFNLLVGIPLYLWWAQAMA
ncbi:MAG TPA: sodium-dependent bicarbonate transport family permease, partial [Thauera sp.]|nr:sodium-dependent bicarbonate transport family permease [Thauera sp.]